MRFKLLVAVAAVLLVSLAGWFFAAEPAPLQLPVPGKTGGMPLMQALAERKSTREFSGKAIPAETLSNLLWAAAGINRAGALKRTAPSARNWQEIDVYAATAEGVYLYNPVANTLEPQLARDARLAPGLGLQPAALEAPVLLIYVADYARMQGAPQDVQDFYSAADAGIVSQNVYLFCASEKLGTVVMSGHDREAMRKELGLRLEQKVLLIQAVGYPRSPSEPSTKRPFLSIPAGNGRG